MTVVCEYCCCGQRRIIERIDGKLQRRPDGIGSHRRVALIERGSSLINDGQCQFMVTCEEIIQAVV
jgi:hypothetical protein